MITGGDYKLDINKYDKEFAEKREGGTKWWVNYVWGWFSTVVAWFFAILGIIWEATDYSQGGYISLLTVLFGLFGIQAFMKCKTWSWNKKLIIPVVLDGIALAITVFILYIFMPYISK